MMIKKKTKIMLMNIPLKNSPDVFNIVLFNNCKTVKILFLLPEN